MNTDSNPYSAPAASAADDPVPEWLRPKSPKVVGILSLIFCALGLISSFIAIFASDWLDRLQGPDGVPISEIYPEGYLSVINVVGLATMLLLLGAGIGLLKYKLWGRRAFYAFAMLTIVTSIVNSIYIYSYVVPNMPAELAAFKANLKYSLVMGIVSSSIFPLVSIMFLARQRVTDALS